MFDVIALLGYYTTLIGGWWVGWLVWLVLWLVGWLIDWLVSFQDRLSFSSSRVMQGTGGCIVV
jgi:hypothetical protein